MPPVGCCMAVSENGTGCIFSIFLIRVWQYIPLTLGLNATIMNTIYERLFPVIGLKQHLKFNTICIHECQIINSTKGMAYALMFPALYGTMVHDGWHWTL